MINFCCKFKKYKEFEKLMIRHFLIIFFLLFPAIVTAQGYFYTESTVQIDLGASVEIKGNAVIQQSIDGDGFMVMNGDNPQTMGGTSVNMNNFRVSNNADVTLTDPLWVNDTLVMTSGTLYLENENLYLADNSIHTGNSTGYIETNGTGYVQRKIDATPFTFHLGNEPEYFPITLTEIGTVDTFRVKAWDILPDDGTSTGTAITTHVALLSFSLIDLVAGGNNLNITMQWNDSKNALDFVQQYAIGIWYNGINYLEMDNCPTNVNSINPNIVSYTGISNIGTFGIGDSIYLTNIPTAYITPGDTAVCQGFSSVMFTAMPPGASLYTWSTLATTQSINVTTAGNYYVDITDTTGCIYRSDEVTLTILSLPTVPVIVQTDTVLSVSPIYSTYQWYLGGSPIGGATGPDYIVTGNGTYSVVVSGTNGCPSTSANYIVSMFGIEEDVINNVTIIGMPNQVYIAMSQIEDCMVYIYDAQGKIVYSDPYTNNYIPLIVQTGIYVVIVQSPLHSYIQKILL